MKSIVYFFMTTMLLAVAVACSNKGELVKEETYIPFDLDILGDTDSELQTLVNNDSIQQSSSISVYVPIGKDFSLKVINRETKTTVLDTTLFQGETQLKLIMYYPGEGLAPVFFEEVGEVEPAPEGHIKARFINLDKEVFAGKTIDLVLKGALLDIRKVKNDTTLFKNSIEEVLRVEGVSPTAFTPFYDIPKAENETHKYLFWEVYDTATKELLYGFYFIEIKGRFAPRGVRFYEILESSGISNYVTISLSSVYPNESAPYGLEYKANAIHALSK